MPVIPVTPALQSLHRIVQLEARIKELTLYSAGLESKVGRLETANLNMRDMLRERDSRIEGQDSALRIKDTRVKELEACVHTLRERGQGQLDAANAQAKTLESLHAGVCRANLNQYGMIQERDKRIKELEARVKELTLYSADCETRIGNLEPALDQAKTRIKELEARISTINANRADAAVARIKEAQSAPNGITVGDSQFEVSNCWFETAGLAEFNQWFLKDFVQPLQCDLMELACREFLQSDDQCYGNDSISTLSMENQEK